MVLIRLYYYPKVSFVKIESQEYVITILNSFHKNTQSTYELESENKLSFLDVVLLKRDYDIEITVYRKSTNNDICLHWESFAPTTWKGSTLKTLVTRAYIICSTE